MMHTVAPIHVTEQRFYEFRSHGNLQRRDLIMMPKRQLDATPQVQLRLMPRSPQQCFFDGGERGLVHSQPRREPCAATSNQVRRARLQVGHILGQASLNGAPKQFQRFSVAGQDGEDFLATNSKILNLVRARLRHEVRSTSPAQSSVDRRFGTNLCSS